MLAVADSLELDNGPRHRGREVTRLCAVTREVKPVADMIRFVVGPDGVVPDLKRNLPGRGVWVTATRSALNEAVKRKAFAKSFKRDVRVPPDLADTTEQMMVRWTLDALAIAGKAGAVVMGFARVEEALAREPLAALIQASDAGKDGVAKLAAALRHRSDADRIASVRRFSTDQLSLALGRPNMVHAALRAGPASHTFLARYERLERFRSDQPHEGQVRHAS
jgi:predicted RNA-binding protein YlxR (DUF448 family)